jgi:hypothetical protein
VNSIATTRFGVMPSHTDRRCALFLFLFLNFLFILTSTGRVRTIDEAMASFETESLVLRRSTSVPQAIAGGLFYGKMDRDGKPQSPYASGHPLAATPWYAAGHFLLRSLPGVPLAAGEVMDDFAVTLSNATWAALAAAVTFLLFRKMGLEAADALFATLLATLATPLFAYSGWFYSEPLAALLLLAAALALFAEPPDLPVSDFRAALGGIMLALAVWVRPAHGIAAPVFLAALLLRGSKAFRAAAIVAGLVGIAAAAYLVRNDVLFGNPFDFGYPPAAEGGKQLNTFQTPLLTGLLGFLISPGKSVFLFAPPVVLAICGLPRLWRRDRGLAVVAFLTPLVYLFFYAKYTQWEGGYCFGPRYMVPAISLLCLGLGPVLLEATPRIRAVAWALLVAGFLVQCVGLSTSFLEDQARGGYYDVSWNYNFWHSPLWGQGRLLFHYLTDPAPAPIGRGFDRWFVFLAKAGVSKGVLAAIGLLAGAGAALSAWQLKRALAESSRGESAK